MISGILQFDDSGRLWINHECEMCNTFPLEDWNEPCLNCGHSLDELVTLESYVNRANKAIDILANSVEDVKEIDVRKGFLQLSCIKLGNGFDEVLNIW